MPQQLNDLLAGVAANNMQAIGLVPVKFSMQ